MSMAPKQYQNSHAVVKTKSPKKAVKASPAPIEKKKNPSTVYTMR